MALKQTLALSTTKQHFPKHSAPRILRYITHVPFNTSCNLSLKCSVEYQYNQAVEYSKPAEIPWRKELCNTVHLIGNVGTPVEIRHLSSGKVVASTRLAVRKSASQTSWYAYIFFFLLSYAKTCLIMPFGLVGSGYFCSCLIMPS